MQMPPRPSASDRQVRETRETVALALRLINLVTRRERPIGRQVAALRLAADTIEQAARSSRDA